MVARNRRAVMSVCGKFENEYYHRYCKTKKMHRAVICCWFVAILRKRVPNCQTLLKKKIRGEIFQKVFSKSFFKKFFFPREDAYGDAYGDAYEYARCLWRCLSITPQRS